MAQFFRRIRQNLLIKSKTGNYLKYAIGEIVLVVIGILIALQINNWNEVRKEKRSMKTAIKSLIIDLEQDTLQLHSEIDYIEKDLQLLDNFRERLSIPTATIDTLKHIARYEFIPFFNPSNEINRNTIVSLLSTGTIDYFEETLKSKILSHHADQLKLIKVMDENVSIFLNSQYSHGLAMQSEVESPFGKPAFIKGPLLDQYWSNKDDKEFLDNMLSKISGKILMDQILYLAKTELLNKTNETLSYLNNFMDKND